MESNGIFGGTISILGKALDLRSLRHNSIISDIANKDTPNYKAFDFLVEEQLTSVMNGKEEINLIRTNARHYPGRKSSISNIAVKYNAHADFSQRSDGNTVNLEKTMANLVENNLMYNASAQIISKKFQGLKNIIQGGR